jgi:hypothetical protein
MIGKQYEQAAAESLCAQGIVFPVVKFGDVGCKDVTEFLEQYSVDELVRRMGLPDEYGPARYQPTNGDITP